MSKEKLTPWFPGNVKPLRKGVYERDWWLDGGPDFGRLYDAMGYRDCDVVVFKALVACADKGDVDAIAAIKCLISTYAELNAEYKG